MTTTVAPLTTTPPLPPQPVSAASQAKKRLSSPWASLAALVVVLTTIAIATLKVFDIVRSITGGQFGTSVVANEFYSQSFSADNQGLGAALAVVLFVLVVPIVAYNIRQLRASEAS